MVVYTYVVQYLTILSTAFQILYESHVVLGNTFLFFSSSVLDSCCAFCYPTGQCLQHVTIPTTLYLANFFQLNRLIEITGPHSN